MLHIGVRAGDEYLVTQPAAASELTLRAGLEGELLLLLEAFHVHGSCAFSKHLGMYMHPASDVDFGFSYFF